MCELLFVEGDSCLQAASHEADSARKSIEEIEGRFETVRKARKERSEQRF